MRVQGERRRGRVVPLGVRHDVDVGRGAGGLRPEMRRKELIVARVDIAFNQGTRRGMPFTEYLLSKWYLRTLNKAQLIK